MYAQLFITEFERHLVICRNIIYLVVFAFNDSLFSQNQVYTLFISSFTFRYDYEYLNQIHGGVVSK